MPDEKRLIPGHLLLLDSFREALQTLLGLSPAQLHQLSSIADSPKGFSIGELSVKFAEQASLALESAGHSLTMAEYLYERCRDEHISPDDAVVELAEIATKMGVKEVPEKEAALRALLSSKEDYELGKYSRSRAVSVAAHFEDLDGVWDIRPVFHRDTGQIIARVPILLVSVSWHDATHTSHNAVFQFNDEDWAELKQQIEKLDSSVKTLLSPCRRFERHLSAEAGSGPGRGFYGRVMLQREREALSEYLEHQ